MTVVTQINNALDAMYQKLKTDSRIAPGFECVRAAPVEEPSSYPILYFEEGLSENRVQTTTRNRVHTIKTRVRFFLKNRNGEEGTAEARERCLSIVHALTETPDDRRLMQPDGQTLSLDVTCPRFAWGVFARDTKTDEIVFAGSVDVEITLLI